MPFTHKYPHGKKKKWPNKTLIYFSGSLVICIVSVIKSINVLKSTTIVTCREKVFFQSKTNINAFYSFLWYILKRGQIWPYKTLECALQYCMHKRIFFPFISEKIKAAKKYVKMFHRASRTKRPLFVSSLLFLRFCYILIFDCVTV